MEMTKAKSNRRHPTSKTIATLEASKLAAKKRVGLGLYFQGDESAIIRRHCQIQRLSIQVMPSIPGCQLG